MAGGEASHSGGNDESLEHDGTGAVLEGLLEECEHGDASGRGEELVQVSHAEEHGDGVEPGGDEANDNSSHDSERDGSLWARDLLCEMRGAVETGEGPVSVDEADDESDSVLFPAGVVDEGREDELRILVCVCCCRNGDEDHDKGG